MKQLSLLWLAGAAVFVSTPLIAATQTSEPPPPQIGSLTGYDEISDRRWIAHANGVISFVISSRGKLVVTAGAGNQSPIPFSALRLSGSGDPEVLSYEFVQSVGVDTGSTWVGGFTGYLNPGYPVYNDVQANRNFGRYYNIRQKSDENVTWRHWTPYRKVSFRSWNGQYVCAENGGGSLPLVVNRNAIGPWETFLLQNNSNVLDRVLNSGDVFSLLASYPTFVFAEGGGGDLIYANRAEANAWEHFIIQKLNGSGPIVNGDQVSIRTQDRGYYLCAEEGGGGLLSGNRTVVGPWETFTIIIHE